jgi:hypothetical protein
VRALEEGKGRGQTAREDAARIEKREPGAGGVCLRRGSSGQAVDESGSGYWLRSPVVR